MKKIKFSKMHSLNNDFMIIETITQKDIYLSSNKIYHLANRYSGVGFDQLLIVEPPYNKGVDFHYRIFNASGNEVYQCANGMRCLALFLHIKNLTNKKKIYISTHNNKMIIYIKNNNIICVDMGEPIFEPKRIPFITSREKKNYIINVNDTKLLHGAVSIGNPHCVFIVKNIDTALVETIGPIIENCKLFPERVNVGFMQIVNSQCIRLRVYERNIGETQACGSGACAAVSIGIKQNLLNKCVKVHFNSGQLLIIWHGPGSHLYMFGSAKHSYDGYIYI